MRATAIYLAITCLLILTGACGASVEEACENLTEQCGLDDGQHQTCLDDGHAREDSDSYADDALDCIADAQSCDAARACKVVDEGDGAAGEGGS